MNKSESLCATPLSSKTSSSDNLQAIMSGILAASQSRPDINTNTSVPSAVASSPSPLPPPLPPQHNVSQQLRKITFGTARAFPQSKFFGLLCATG